MDTAIADTIDVDQDQHAFAREEAGVVFLSRRIDLRLIRVPRYPVLAPGSARQIGEEAGQCVDFHGGRFICPREGDVALEDGRKVDAAELLEWLEAHRLNGDVNGGFWRVDPQAPAVSAAELEALVTAAGTYDEVALERILSSERAGWQREQILRVAEGALERVRKVNELAEREAALEAREAALAGGDPAIEAANEAKVAAQPTPPADAPPILGNLADQLHEGQGDPSAEPTE